MQQTDEWGQPIASPQNPSTITVQQLEALVTQMHKVRLDYKAAKDLASEKYKLVEEAENQVMGALKSLGRKNFEVNGLGTAYIISKEQFNSPATDADKQQLFNYIESKYGGEALLSMLSIHSQKLNSWANKETESGDVMEIPGLATPVISETVGFRKKD